MNPPLAWSVGKRPPLSLLRRPRLRVGAAVSAAALAATAGAVTAAPGTDSTAAVVCLCAADSPLLAELAGATRVDDLAALADLAPAVVVVETALVADVAAAATTQPQAAWVAVGDANTARAYIVRRGDGWYRVANVIADEVAADPSVTVDDVLAWNQATINTPLHPGDLLLAAPPRDNLTTIVVDPTLSPPDQVAGISLVVTALASSSTATVAGEPLQGRAIAAPLSSLDDVARRAAHHDAGTTSAGQGNDNSDAGTDGSGPGGNGSGGNGNSNGGSGNSSGGNGSGSGSGSGSGNNGGSGSGSGSGSSGGSGSGNNGGSGSGGDAPAPTDPPATTPPATNPPATNPPAPSAQLVSGGGTAGDWALHLARNNMGVQHGNSGYAEVVWKGTGVSSCDRAEGAWQNSPPHAQIVNNGTRQSYGCATNGTSYWAVAHYIMN